MERRRFLQLAAGAAASATAHQLYALSAPFLMLSLRSRQLLLSGMHATVISLHGDPLLTRSTREAALIEMIWERRFNSPGNHFQWVINGKPCGESEPLQLTPAHRYRLRVMNATGQNHSLSMQQHGLQLTRIDQTEVSGPLQDAIDLERYAAVDADIVLSKATEV